MKSDYTLGSLFTGIGGLDLGVEMVFGPANRLWVSDIAERDKKGHVIGNAPAVIEKRFSGVPNLGDVTKIDWDSVPRVDVLTGGSPCQDLSVGGRRAGMMPGTRSGLWMSMFEGVKRIRPHLVVWENVRGAYSASAYSSMEPEDGRVVLRGLGRVLGDLAGIRYDAGWCGVRASEVGAPHQRFRVFVLAWPKDDRWWLDRGMVPQEVPPRAVGVDRLLPTPTARDGKGRNQRNDDSCLWGAVEQHTRGSYFGPYQYAVDEWSRVFRPAPVPAEPATKPGKYRLNAELPEWMMGFPNGWVTDVGLPRVQEFRALGGAVVPQQAALAITKIAYMA